MNIEPADNTHNPEPFTLITQARWDLSHVLRELKYGRPANIQKLIDTFIDQAILFENITGMFFSEGDKNNA